MFCFTRAVAAFAAACLAVALAPGIARADGTLRGEYFILPGNHPDVDHAIDGSPVKGLVQKHLGPDGLPVVSRFGSTYAGPSGPIRDVNAAGELMWFTTRGTHGVRRDKLVTSDKLPFLFTSMFPTGKTNDGGANGYRTAHWSGTFVQTTAGSIGFTLGSDDDSWVFVDGTLAVDNGGVKPMQQVPYTVTKLSAGPHRFDVFFADRHGSGAALALSTGFALVPRVDAAHALPPPAKPKVAAVANAASLASQIKKTGHVAVYGIHFAFDRADITRDSSAVLLEVAKVLRGDPSLRLRIEGHTDGAGDAAYNRDLSQRRADAVKAYLVRTFAIASSRLTTQGFGPDRPVATNATALGRAKNRRVELVRI